MIHARRVAILTSAVAALFALDACRKKPQVAPAPAVNADSAARADSIARAQEAAAREQARLDSIRRAQEAAAADSARRAQEAAAAALANVRTALTAVVHFDFDQSNIRPDAQAALDAKIPVLQANTAARIRIEGHADERGSDEYNQALGMRRATAAKQYLTSHGIDASRIDVASFGEERPVCQEHEESCWSQNRRDEFVIVAGGDNLRAP